MITRAQWNARAREGKQHLASTKGVKIHYMGSYVNPNLLTYHGKCPAAVRAVQNQHMDGNGWADIGYNYVVCPHGAVFEGRGIHVLPAANGAGLNTEHYAVLALVGNSGLVKPTIAMKNGLRDAIEYCRDKGDAGDEIKGHRDGYATECPGDLLYTWVKSGAKRINKDKDLDMDEKTLYETVWERDVVDAPSTSRNLKKNPRWKASSFLREIFDSLTGVHKRVDALEEKVDLILEAVQDVEPAKPTPAVTNRTEK